MAESTALARMAHHHAQRAERAEKRESRLRERGARVIEKIVRTGEVALGATIGGLIQGKAQTGMIGPVPIDLGLGVIANGLAAADVFGDRASEHLGNVGDGLIAAWGADLGHAVGARWKNTGRLFGPGAPAIPPPAGPPPGQPAVHGELDPRVVAEQIIRGR